MKQPFSHSLILFSRFVIGTCLIVQLTCSNVFWYAINRLQMIGCTSSTWACGCMDWRRRFLRSRNTCSPSKCQWEQRLRKWGTLSVIHKSKEFGKCIYHVCICSAHAATRSQPVLNMFVLQEEIKRYSLACWSISCRISCWPQGCKCCIYGDQDNGKQGQVFCWSVFKGASPAHDGIEHTLL